MASIAEELFIAFGRRKPMRPLEEVVAITDKGLTGCAHGRPGSKRQVLLVEAEMLAEFGLEPGIIRENITTVGLRHSELREGQRLSIGQATFQVTGPCAPCERMDEIRMGLQAELRGRRGMLCRVVKGGVIRRGDAIEVITPF
jgi:MOSC domain-containing protein YiiM